MSLGKACKRPRTKSRGLETFDKPISLLVTVLPRSTSRVWGHPELEMMRPSERAKFLRYQYFIAYERVALLIIAI